MVVGVFSTWATAGPVTLNGIEGPNDGWLVVILAALAVLWARMLEREGWRGWIGAVGVLGAALVMFCTALESWADNREILDASVGHGLLLVVAASSVLALVATFRALELFRSRAPG